MQLEHWIRIASQAATWAFMSVLGSGSASWAQTASIEVPSVTEQRIEMFQQNRNNPNESQAEKELLNWSDEVMKEYWDWRRREIDAQHSDMFRRNKENPNQDQAQEERLDWDRSVMRQYWKWRQIEVDAAYIKVKKLAIEVDAAYIKVKKLADATHTRLVNEYDLYIKTFLEFRELQGQPGFNVNLYNKMKKELQSVLKSGEPREVLPKVEAIRRLLE